MIRSALFTSVKENVVRKRNCRLGLLLALSASVVFAAPVMTKAQYEDYSVLYHCTEIKVFDDLKDKSAEQQGIDKQFGVSEENYPEFEQLIDAYEKDSALLDRVRDRVNKECKGKK
jgi:hypothetical protein